MMNLPYFLLENIRHMVTAMKKIAHPENYITNHDLIKLIVLDTLSHQGKSWDEFMRKKARTTCRK